jgi:hypothetical protein
MLPLAEGRSETEASAVLRRTTAVRPAVTVRTAGQRCHLTLYGEARNQYQRYQALAFRLLAAATLLRMAKRSFITAPPLGGGRVTRAGTGIHR